MKVHCRLRKVYLLCLLLTELTLSLKPYTGTGLSAVVSSLPSVPLLRNFDIDATFADNLSSVPLLTTLCL